MKHRSLVARVRRFASRALAPALLAAPVLAAGAQSLYVPRDVKQALARGTRSPDGKPGPHYWQNRARYAMTLTTSPPNRNVSGTERIVYHNESPDTLRRLVMRFIVNIHKPGAQRAGGVTDDYLTSGVHVDSFAVNGQSRRWATDAGFTAQGLPLATPLMPHDSVQLDFVWHYDMSKLSGREGAIDSTTFFMAYAYPRVSVYDDYNGWDTTPFDDRLEFYSDFNDYDVTVRVPANFVVWGTGTLLNPQEVLQPAILQRYQASLTSEQTINVATAAEMKAHGVTVQQPFNAWHFRAANVPDVTFATSDHYVWDAGSVAVADGRPRASVQAAYNESAVDYRQMVRYAAHALDWFSHNWPGVPYPYEKSVVVQGFAGMEYPMMVNDESYRDTVMSRFVAEHEIAHTYFPFYMGINETRYGFMDEGWATTLENLIGTADLGPTRAAEFFKQFRVARWTASTASTEDLPIITPFLTGNNAYGKPALGYLALKEMLGDSLFRKALHTYMDRWNGKHPIPWDFFNTFNDATGQNLDWFWRSWFFQSGYIDLRLANVAWTASGYRVTIDNVGGMPAPVSIVLRYAAAAADTVRATSAIWRTNQARAVVSVPTKRRAQSVELAGGIWMDADSTNNRFTVK